MKLPIMRMLNEQDDYLTIADEIPDDVYDEINNDYMNEPYSEEEYMKQYADDCDDFEKHMDSLNEDRKVRVTESLIRGILMETLMELSQTNGDAEFSVIAFYGNGDDEEEEEKDLVITLPYRGGEMEDYEDEVGEQIPSVDENGNELIYFDIVDWDY